MSSIKPAAIALALALQRPAPPHLAGLRTAAPVPRASVDNRILAARPGDTLIFGLGDRSSHFHVSREDIQGDRLYLRRFPGHLRGQVSAEPVDLALSPPRITGVLGDRNVMLEVIAGQVGLDIAGHFGFREVRLTLEMDRIRGEVGPCRYDLTCRRGIYEGHVDCGGPPERVSLIVPVTFIARPTTEIAAMLVAILAR
jgi:hypothetical protein